MRHIKLFENFSQNINEGAWALPKTVEDAKFLSDLIDKLVNDPDYVFYTRDHVGSGHGNPQNNSNDLNLYDVLGEDGLFDMLVELTHKKYIGNKPVNNKKIADAIKDTIKWYVEAYEKNPDDFKAKADEKAIDILKSILKK